MDELSELIYLMANRQFDEDEAISMAAAARAEVDDGEFDWIDGEDRQLMFAVEGQLMDWFAIGDKIDELHEQISAWFDPPLPPFPGLDPPGYMQWLDDVLAKRENNYELLEFDNYFDDNIHATTVLRADMPRILALCRALKFRAYPATKAFERGA
jgi:hypothetical protein